MIAAAIVVATVIASSPLAPYERLARSPSSTRILAVARAAMEDHWRAAAAGADTIQAPDWAGEPVGVYVTLLRGRESRACVGSATPTRASLGETVRSLAVEALSADRRRPPVRRDELARLRIVVAFVDEGEPIADPMLVDPARQGLLVTSERGSVAFLPGEARTIRWALAAARRAGIIGAAAQEVRFRRFHAVTMIEPEKKLTDEETSDGPD
jgi:AMMECR1 domain-containing protein